MQVHDLAPAPGATKNAKRVGRGTGGKGGKTAGRGSKPLKQRVPKLKGFNNPFRVEYQAVNLHALSALVDTLGDSTVTPEVLVANGLLRKKAFVKVLARGEISAKVDLHVHAISAAAETAVTAAGGTVTLIELPFREEGKAGRPAVKGNQFANR